MLKKNNCLINNFFIASRACALIKIFNCLKKITAVIAFLLIVCNAFKMCKN